MQRCDEMLLRYQVPNLRSTYGDTIIDPHTMSMPTVERIFGELKFQRHAAPEPRVAWARMDSIRPARGCDSCGRVAGRPQATRPAESVPAAPTMRLSMLPCAIPAGWVIFGGLVAITTIVFAIWCRFGGWMTRHLSDLRLKANASWAIEPYLQALMVLFVLQPMQV
jgi:hypothetical protein